MKQSYEFPRVITRGRYDLNTGKRIGKHNSYSLFPKKKFDKIFKAEELVIFVHGMRNSPKGAVMGGMTLRRKLRKLGYKKYPVISFSYDANIRGAHIYSDYDRVISLAEKIAFANGKHLLHFIEDLRKVNPLIRIHLVGHSLGCEVIDSFISHNVAGHYIHSIHYFGSPVPLHHVIETKNDHNIATVVNYYNPKDEVIKHESDIGRCYKPSCLNKVPNINHTSLNKSTFKLKNVRCSAVHHGFKAYADKLRKFP